MPFRCFIKDCPGKQTSPNNTEKRFTCFSPNSIEVLERWNKVLHFTKKEMTLRHKLCELHFEEIYIERYFQRTLKDGCIFKLLRERPILSSEAVPTIFGFECERRKQDLERGSSEEMSEKSCMRGPEEPVENQVSDNIPGGEFSFAFLKENIKDIKLPRLCWSVSPVLDCENNYIVITKWFDFKPERWIIIKDDLDVRVLLKDYEVGSGMKINSIDDINEVIRIVHDYLVCAGFQDKEMTDCSKIIGSTKLFGRTRVWCTGCSTLRRKKAEVLRKPKNQKNKHKLYQDLSCARRKNERLNHKILRLKRIVASYKKKYGKIPEISLEEAITLDEEIALEEKIARDEKIAQDKEIAQDKKNFLDKGIRSIKHEECDSDESIHVESFFCEEPIEE